MTTMVVLVDLKDGVAPEDYERWVEETYRPAILALPSVENWRGYRAETLLGSTAPVPHDYVVTLDVTGLEALAGDMASDEIQRLLDHVHELADLTQVLAERFV